MKEKSKNIKDKAQIRESFLETTWSEIKECEEGLLKMHSELVAINKQLQSKYKTIASTVNEKYSIETFLKPTDYTASSLYYCFNPMLEATALFFIPTKDGQGLIPIQAALNNLSDKTSPTIHIGYNPQYELTKLQEQSITIMDVIIPYEDVPSFIKNEHVQKLGQLFETPPAAANADLFDNYVKERLFALTQSDFYKKTEALPEN